MAKDQQERYRGQWHRLTSAVQTRPCKGAPVLREVEVPDPCGASVGGLGVPRYILYKDPSPSHSVLFILKQIPPLYTGVAFVHFPGNVECGSVSCAHYDTTGDCDAGVTACNCEDALDNKREHSGSAKGLACLKEINSTIGGTRGAYCSSEKGQTNCALTCGVCAESPQHWIGQKERGCWPDCGPKYEPVLGLGAAYGPTSGLPAGAQAVACCGGTPAKKLTRECIDECHGYTRIRIPQPRVCGFLK